jgi:hypothetical protein
MALRMTLSVSSCLAIRERLAPNARRTASSRWRAVPRASNKVATFAQTMISTTTASANVVSAGRLAAIACSLIGSTSKRRVP